jgi:thermostable 8-oxoguanine DNA glycosylase
VGSQLVFRTVLEQSIHQRQRRIHAYVRDNVDRYRGMAHLITPDPTNWEHVWDRIAFSILSANAPFTSAVSALGYAAAHRGKVSAQWIAQWQMIPGKADYLNALPCGQEILRYTRGVDESWHAYRMRLRRIKGLGLAKASFAACLLYPLESDLACVDTHMQKVYLGHETFKTLSIATYCEVEAEIRKIARAHGINTFLAQWLIWDHVRGKVENHNIFPGSHKTEDLPAWLA